MTRLNARVGDIVEVLIWDHVQGSDTLEKVLVYGRISTITPDTVTVDSWALPDTADAEREKQKHDVTQFALIRSAILKIDVLKRGK